VYEPHSQRWVSNTSPLPPPPPPPVLQRRPANTTAIWPDFNCQVPIPFSVFPSSYKTEQTAETTEVKTKERITVQDAGREGRDQFSQAPSRRDDRYTRQDIRITEEDRYRQDSGRNERVRREEDIRVREDDRPRERRDTRIEVDRERT